jgi:hypothetical protein
MLITKHINLEEHDCYTEDGLVLSRIFYEKDSHEQLLAYLINNNMKDSEGYLRLWADYLTIVQKWRFEIKKFENTVVKEFVSQGAVLQNWTYNFETGGLDFDELQEET